MEGGWLGLGFAGPSLRALRRLWGGWGFRAVREGRGLFASKACSGSVPLRPWGWVVVVGLALGGAWVVASRFLGWAAILRADEVEARGEGS